MASQISGKLTPIRSDSVCGMIQGMRHRGSKFLCAQVAHGSKQQGHRGASISCALCPAATSPHDAQRGPLANQLARACWRSSRRAAPPVVRGQGTPAKPCPSEVLYIHLWRSLGAILMAFVSRPRRASRTPSGSVSTCVLRASLSNHIFAGFGRAGAGLFQVDLTSLIGNEYRAS